MQDCPKAVGIIPYVSLAFFPSLKQKFLHRILLNCPHVQIAFLKFTVYSRVCSNSYCSCSFELRIFKIRQASHTIYSNKILDFQESITILNASTKKVWKLIEYTTYSYLLDFLFGFCHIYIYCHPQTDSFVVSQLFSVARLVGCLKL